MNEIDPPPFLLDSARVLIYAETGGSDAYTGRITVYSDGIELGPVPRLAICEDLTENRFLVMRCDASWNVLAVNFSPTVEEALKRAEREYNGISLKWNKYRDLTTEEVCEVEEKRKRLRKLVEDFPIDDV